MQMNSYNKKTAKSKISLDDVREIKALAGKHSPEDIATMVGRTEPSIRKICQSYGISLRME